MAQPFDKCATIRPAAPVRDDVEGLLLVDKPQHMTSHDVVAIIRRNFRYRKVGHGGTLDPMATGLLIILLGRGGTRLSQWIMGGDKEYEGVMHLGIRTDTQDLEGRVIAEQSAADITREVLEREMRRFTGDIMQTPPMVSAVKQQGTPLYKLARKGMEVERKPRLRHVFRFDLLEYNPPYAHFRAACTKGTYIRTLCADLGDVLGCGAHLRELRRTKSGSLVVENAYPLDRILKMDRQAFEQAVIGIHALDRSSL